MQDNEKQLPNDEQMLSTLDNPYNPFENFNGWNQFDQAKGYYTLSYLGRVVDYSGCFTEEQRRNAREAAIDEIITLNPLGIYCRVYKNEKVKPIEVFNEQT